MSGSTRHASAMMVPAETADGSRERARRLLLWCGTMASLLYGAMIWGFRYDGYDPISQTVSELSAWGVSTRSLWLALGIVWQLLMIAFAVGVWVSSGHHRSLRVTGGLLVAYGLVGLAWPFASMHRREVLAAGGGTASDTAHLALVSIGGLLLVAAMVCAAAAFGAGFRLYTAATILTVVVFGALTSMDADRVQADQPTPWAGLWERVNIMAFLLWVVVLGIALRRAPSERR